VTHHRVTLLSKEQSNTVANRPRTRANEIKGDFAQFKDFARRLMAVPHSEIKAALDAEREAKKQKPASRDSSDQQD
jgi:hypothetical protein